MLPHNHFLISGLAAVPIAAVLSPEKSIIEWALISGFLSSAIDLDVYTLVLLKSRKEDKLKPFRNPLKILKEYKNFMQIITETSVLKIGLKTHFILPTFIALLSYFLFPAYFIPAAVGVVTHVLSDIPNLWRIIKTNKGG